MTIQTLLTDINCNLKIGGTGDYESLNTKLTASSFNYTTSNIYRTDIYSSYDGTGSNLKLYSSNTVKNDFTHNLDGLVKLLNSILPTQSQTPFAIPKLNYNNTNIINSYSSLRDISKTIRTHKDNEKITRNDIDKTKKNIDLQYYEIIIVIIILIILIIITGVLNINNKKRYVKYILLITIILFLITYIFNGLFIQIEPFTTTPNLYGFDTFKGEANLLNTEYTSKLNNLPSVNNYYDVYYYLTKKAIETDSTNILLNKLVTKYAIINMLYIFSEKSISTSEKYINNNQTQNTTDYITEIDKNLKKEVKKNINANNVIKMSAKTAKEYYYDLYIKSLYYRDIVYLLIYIILISILLNVVFIEFGYNRIFVGLYTFLFILGILIYSYYYFIRVRTNPTNRYF
jgi:hypothetical protein